uniref:ERAP1-like C-terminal domain-containing protein n=1 Tax=uncultured Agrococcus sp. TaxID=382258 RepID=UPI0025D49562
RVGNALWTLAQQAEADSDAQFQFVTGFANIASTDEHVSALAALREGRTSLECLEIDTDLSWQLLDGLVHNGAAGEQEIAAAHEKDNTANGAQAAVRARALIPTPEGKRAAFDSVVLEETPNMIVRYTGLGLGRANDPSTLATLIEPYHAAIDTIWEQRSYQMAEELIKGLYPSSVASEELAEATRAWLNERERAAGLTRLVRELLDDVERALSNQRRDAQDTGK